VVVVSGLDNESVGGIICGLVDTGLGKALGVLGLVKGIPCSRS